MPGYERTVEITAPIETVWAVTTDVESWPSWSPTMDEIRRPDDGPLRAGSTATVRQPKLRPAVWTVDEVQEPTTFTWSTTGPGYEVVAEHHLTGTEAGTSLVLRTSVTGLFAPFAWLIARRTIRSYVDQEADALRERCTS